MTTTTPATAPAPGYKNRLEEYVSKKKTHLQLIEGKAATLRRQGYAVAVSTVILGLAILGLSIAALPVIPLAGDDTARNSQLKLIFHVTILACSVILLLVVMYSITLEFLHSAYRGWFLFFVCVSIALIVANSMFGSFWIATLLVSGEALDKAKIDAAARYDQMTKSSFYLSQDANEQHLLRVAAQAQIDSLDTITTNVSYGVISGSISAALGAVATILGIWLWRLLQDSQKSPK